MSGTMYELCGGFAYLHRLWQPACLTPRLGREMRHTQYTPYSLNRHYRPRNKEPLTRPSGCTQSVTCCCALGIIYR